MAKTKEARFDEMLSQATELAQPTLDMIKDVEQVYEGEYGPIEVSNSGYRVKTHLLFDMINRTVAMLMPPPYFEFVGEPASKEQEADLNSAETAQSLAEYFFNKKSGQKKIREVLVDMGTGNRGYVRVGYREDKNRDSSVGAVEADGEDKGKGQAYFERVKARDFRIARGFGSIEEAWSPGGWIARQFFPHVEWVKANKSYKNNRDIRADVEYKGKDPTDTTGGTVQHQNSHDEDLKYVALWEMFLAPTPKKPDGQYIIFCKTQKKILYESDSMPYEGIGFPMREIAHFTPRDGYWTTPLAKRSLNPLLEHEWFETDKLRMAKESKELIITDDAAADETRALMEKGGGLIVTGSGSFKPQDVQHISIQNDITAVQQGSFAALGRFERMWGFSGTEARMQGGKIATEMVIENKIFMTEINTLKVRVQHFIEEIAQDLIAIAKQKMSVKEQVRITRSMKKVWKDSDEVTLEGNYSITLKSKPLYDMTDGERGSVTQMILSSGVQLEQIPKYARRLDMLDIYKQWVEDQGFSTARMIDGDKFADAQGEELALLMSEMPVQVDPDDDHVEHLTVIQQFMTIQDQSGDSTIVTDTQRQLIEQHAQQHQQILQQMQGGSAGASFAEQSNPTNNARSAGSASVSGGAVGGALQQTAQGGR